MYADQLTVYEVLKPVGYRGHRQGETFTGALKPTEETVAVRCGLLRVLERTVPNLQPGSYQLPDGWANL